MVRADAALLDQALFNLVENAIAHARSGEIVVGAAQSRGDVTFTVVDQGQGILPGDEVRIFERFARAASSGVSGTGLGLAIVKGFVSLMGAHVSARNRSDRSGGSFHDHVSRGKSGMSDQIEKRASGQRLRALIVDDEAAIRRFLRSALIAEAFDVEEASDVAGALSLAAGSRFDLAVLDLGLPDGNGADLIGPNAGGRRPCRHRSFRSRRRAAQGCSA